jgi:hypothetical protein
MQHHETEQLFAYLANKAQYVGSLVAGIGAFLNEYAAAVGAVVAISGFLINLYYQKKADKYKKAEHELRVRMLLDGKSSGVDE